MFELERPVAEQFAPPAAERGHFRSVARGDRLEIVDGGDQLAGDAALLAHLSEEHFEQLDRRADIGAVAPVALDLRQRLGIARKPALDRRQNFPAGARPLHPARERAQVAERLDAARGGERELDQHVVLQHPRPGHVARLRLALAPGCKLHQHREVAGLPRLGPVALPGALGMLLVGRRRVQRLHFVVEPRLAPGGRDALRQLSIDVAQMGHVADRVVDLRLGQRPARPIGEPRRLVDRDMADRVCKLAIGHLLAIAANHRRDLGVEQRRRQDAGELPEDFEVLPGGVEHLDHVLVGHQLQQRLEVESGSERVDRHRFVVGGELDNAKNRPERRLAQEFGVDRHERRARQALAGLSEFVRRRDQGHFFRRLYRLSRCGRVGFARSLRTAGGA